MLLGVLLSLSFLLVACTFSSRTPMTTVELKKWGDQERAAWLAKQEVKRRDKVPSPYTSTYALLTLSLIPL